MEGDASANTYCQPPSAHGPVWPYNTADTGDRRRGHAIALYRGAAVHRRHVCALPPHVPVLLLGETGTGKELFHARASPQQQGHAAERWRAWGWSPVVQGGQQDRGGGRWKRPL